MVNKFFKSSTNIILVLNLILMMLAYIAAIFWVELGLTDNDNIYLGLIGIIIFGLSIGGIFAGFAERKKKGEITRIGIIGNFVLTLLFLLMFGFAIAEMT